jgi:hypothetical protein
MELQAATTEIKKYPHAEFMLEEWLFHMNRNKMGK